MSPQLHTELKASLGYVRLCVEQQATKSQAVSLVFGEAGLL